MRAVQTDKEPLMLLPHGPPALMSTGLADKFMSESGPTAAVSTMAAERPLLTTAQSILNVSSCQRIKKTNSIVVKCSLSSSVKATLKKNGLGRKKPKNIASL